MNRIRIIFGLVILFAITLFTVILLITTYSPRPTTYSVNVNTEIVKVTTSDQLGAQFDITGAIVYHHNGDSLIVRDAFLSLKRNVTLTVEWVSNELVILSFESDNSSNSIGELEYRGNKTIDISNNDVISIQNLVQKRVSNGAIIIPFFGTVQVGRNVGLLGSYSDYGVLKSGEITMIGKSILQNKYFEAGKHELSLGDEVLMDETQSDATGLIYIGEEDGLRVSYRIVALKAWIKKPGAVNNETKFQISTSLLNRFINDQLFRTLSLIVAFLIGVLTLVEFVRKSYPISLKSKKRKRKK